jgi:hypothetical protein
MYVSTCNELQPNTKQLSYWLDFSYNQCHVMKTFSSNIIIPSVLKFVAVIGSISSVTSLVKGKLIQDKGN